MLAKTIRAVRQTLSDNTKIRLTVAFCFGAGLEVFMNLFWVRNANIYKSMRERISSEMAENSFVIEKSFYEWAKEDSKKET